MCLELGRGTRGSIGHTQPRRIAARTVAERIAEELGTEVGQSVGYTVRFTDEVGPTTLVKLMTDGILLAEIQRDRLLTRYDTIIVDEAHERSLNIDFLLGYLKELLPRRPDLKVIVTSATIDPERFAHHFDDAPDRRGLRPHLPGRGPLPARWTRRTTRTTAPTATATRRTRSRASARRSRSWPARATATCSSSSPASARSATPPRRSEARTQTSRLLRGIEVLPLYARLSAPPSSTASSPPSTSRGASCSPRTSPRPR